MTEEFPLAAETDIRAAVTDLIEDRIPADLGLKHAMRSLYETPSVLESHRESFGGALIQLAQGKELNISCIGTQLHNIPISASQFTALATHLFEALGERGADRLSTAIKSQTGALHNALVEKDY